MPAWRRRFRIFSFAHCSQDQGQPRGKFRNDDVVFFLWRLLRPAGGHSGRAPQERTARGGSHARSDAIFRRGASHDGKRGRGVGSCSESGRAWEPERGLAWSMPAGSRRCWKCVGAGAQPRMPPQESTDIFEARQVVVGTKCWPRERKMPPKERCCFFVLEVAPVSVCVLTTGVVIPAPCRLRRGRHEGFWFLCFLEGAGRCCRLF